jgi:K+/H+ antiporter YhaU regulatory subunit KhtT
MTWQRSIQNAVRALKKEEATLRKQLETVQRKIAELQGMARTGGSVAARKPATRRRLSPKGRAAISRAAKKRWREYRAQQRKA